jgi:hypothetical protein
MVQVVEHLPSKHEALNLIPRTVKRKEKEKKPYLCLIKSIQALLIRIKNNSK